MMRLFLLCGVLGGIACTGPVEDQNDDDHEYEGLVDFADDEQEEVSPDAPIIFSAEAYCDYQDC